MGKGSFYKTQLNKVARLYAFQVYLFPEGTGTLLFSGQKVIKIRHPCPSWGPAILTVVVPAKCRSIIHHPGTSVKSLGGEISTVASQFIEIVKIRVPVVGPAVGVGHRRSAVVGAQRHRENLLFPYAMHRRKEKCLSG